MKIFFTYFVHTKNMKNISNNIVHPLWEILQDFVNDYMHFLNWIEGKFDLIREYDAKKTHCEDKVQKLK